MQIRKCTEQDISRLAWMNKHLEETILGYALIKHSTEPLYLRQFYIERVFWRRH